MGAFPMAEEPGQENRDAPSNEDKPSRRRLIGLAIAGAILGAILLVVFLWVWVHPTDPTEKKDFIQAVGVLLAALAALGGLYFTRTSTKDQLEQARENTEKQLRQARKSQEQTQRLTEQGQITDRFTRAIDQLGKVDENNNKLFEIRIGGIYALQRIARESEKDYGPIMEILTAYVREHAPWPPEEPSSEEEVEEGKPPEADIQAILTVIGRCERYPGHRESERLDLQGTNLRCSSALSEAHLAGAYFMEANLSGAELLEANLSGADLSGADLSRANLKGADLSNAILSEADIGGADLSGANLRKAHFSEGTILWDADIRGADFSETDPRTMRRHLESARGDETTRLPPGLKPDELWDGKTDEH
jgi:hypothetical protein